MARAAEAQSELDELDGLLAVAGHSRLSASQCERCVALLAAVPGRTRDVAEALAAQRSAPAVDALLRVPSGTPGRLEGVFQALRHGVTRVRADGRPFPRRLALDFRHARARDFGEVIARAHAAFGPADAARTRFERLDVDGRPHYRVVVHPGAWPPGLAADVVWLHRRTSRNKGTRVWLNGWCFPQDGPVGPSPQTHLVDAWLDWARSASPTGDE